MWMVTRGEPDPKDGRGVNPNGNRDGDEGGNENRNRDENGNVAGDTIILSNRRGSRGGAQYAREAVTPTINSNPQPQPQDATPLRHRRIMRRTKGQGWEARDGTRESGGGAKRRKKAQNSHKRDA